MKESVNTLELDMSLDWLLNEASWEEYYYALDLVIDWGKKREEFERITHQSQQSKLHGVEPLKPRTTSVG